MKKFLLPLFCLFFIFTSRAFAHTGSQPPFFKINGQYVGFYPLQSGGVNYASFDIPQDQAPANYLLNTPIDFEIDTTQVNIPDDTLSHAVFIWDFGDKEKGSGLKNLHTYKKIGSYVLTIYVNLTGENSANANQLFETVFFNIIPDSSYKLPKAVIFVNGKMSKDPVKDILGFDLNNALSFDGSFSKNGNAAITSYMWDFGDGNTSNGEKADHQYQLPQYFVNAVLRVKDKNGFISDAFVGIKNTGKNAPNNPSNTNGIFKILLFVFSGILLLAIIVILITTLKRKK